MPLNAQELHRKDLQPDPFAQFSEWYRMASETEPEVEAAALATASGRAATVRMVLVRRFDENGFQVFTNYNSRKAEDLDKSGQAELLYYWHSLSRQVRISCQATRLGPAESNDYFGSRPRGSQIGAYASNQSSIVADRAELEKRQAAFEEQFKGQEIPRPDFWGGYSLVPERWEFWQGREDRLHDRFEYLSDGEGWRINRLAP